jgi:hypothetical protein
MSPSRPAGGGRTDAAESTEYYGPSGADGAAVAARVRDDPALGRIDVPSEAPARGGSLPALADALVDAA